MTSSDSMPDPFNRGVPDNGPLPQHITISMTERLLWNRLYRKMWPGATQDERKRLEDRMMDLLCGDYHEPITSRLQVEQRLRDMKYSLDRMPLDPHNKLMGG